MSRVSFVLITTIALCCVASSHAEEFTTLPHQGCPMAHCTRHLANMVRVVAPEVGSIARYDALSDGSNKGLGCSSNKSVVACSFNAATPPNLIVYDANGLRVFEDSSGILNSSAYTSAPIVFESGKVLAADDTNLVLFHEDGTLAWKSAKPDSSDPLSPILIRADIVMLATSEGGTMSTWDLRNGKLLSTYRLSRPQECGDYDTVNTPTADGTRAYVLVNCHADPSKGGLVAIDVDVTTDARGTMTPAWFFAFTGPSGASPMFYGGALFFDGVNPRDSTQGVFMGVKDLGTSPQLIWSREFSSVFAAGAAKDPTGGIWVFPKSTPNLYRLNEPDGAILQTITLEPLPGTVGPYQASSALSMSLTSTGDPVLMFGITSQTSGEPAAVMAQNVATNTTLWQTTITFNDDGNDTAAQFPIVWNSEGLPRVVFPGSKFGTFFLGQP